MKKVSQAGVLIAWLFNNYASLIFEMGNASCHVFEESGEDESFNVTLNKWHLECDLWSHTLMVLKGVEQQLLAEGAVFNGKFCENTKLLLAALLHDIGKLYSKHFNKEKKKINFMGHATCSTMMAVPILKSYFEDPANYDKKEPYERHMLEILNIIAFHDHMNTLSLSHESVSTSSQQMLSGLMPTGMVKKLLIHAKADILGSVRTEIENTTVEAIDSLLPDLVDAWCYNDFVPADNMPVCEMLVGVPGSGKTTYRNKSSIKNVVSFDDILTSKNPDISYNEAFDKADKKSLDREVNALINKFASDKVSFIVDMTNVSEKSRIEKFNKLPGDYFKQVTVFLPSFDILLKNVAYRKEKSIPEHVFRSMLTRFQMPFPLSTDYHNVKYILY